jgi:hypothetical protein
LELKSNLLYYLIRRVIFYKDLLHGPLLSHLVQVEVEHFQKGRILLKTPSIRLVIILCGNGNNLTVGKLWVSTENVRQVRKVRKTTKKSKTRKK